MVTWNAESVTRSGVPRSQDVPAVHSINEGVHSLYARNGSSDNNGEVKGFDGRIEIVRGSWGCLCI